MKRPIIFVALLFLLSACANNEDVTPEQQIKQTLAAIEQGIEDRSLSQVIDHISDDYSDPYGRNKKNIKGLTQLQILKNQNIVILTRIKSIDIDNGYASVELSAAMTARGIDLNIEENRLKANSYKSSVVSSSWQRGW